MPLKDWPPKEDWPPRETPRSSREELAKDEQFQALLKGNAPEAAGTPPERPSSQVTEAQEAVETFKRELAALERFRNLLRESYREIDGIKQSADHAAGLRTELEQIRGVAAQLRADYAELHDASREAQERSAAAVEVERKLGRLGQSVNEIQTALDDANRRRDEFVQKTERIEKDGHALAATIATYVERVALEKKQFEEFEQRMEALMECDRQLSYLPERLEEFSRTFEALTNEADELRRKQASLAPLQEMAATVERRLNALQATASDMDAKFAALFARHAELAQKSDEFEQKMTALADREPAVRAVKEELDNVHQMSARNKADLQYIRDHREDLSLLRSRLEELLTLTAAAEQKIRRNF